MIQRTTSLVAAACIVFAAMLWAYGRYQQRAITVPHRDATGTPAIHPQEPGPFIKILSIDGDGIRLIPALHCLAYLEKRGSKPVSKMFDMIVGSGEGALIAAALCAQGENGQPKFTAAALLERFPGVLKAMYATPIIHPLLSLDGRTAPKYLTRRRQQAILDFIGRSALVGDAATTMILPAFVLESNTPFLFASDMSKSTTAGLSQGRSPLEAGDYFLADAVIAATGDPALFAPDRITNVTGDQTFNFTGARAYANNPTLLAVGEAMLRFPQKQCVVVSLGGGSFPDAKPRPRGWTSAASADELLAIAADGSTAVTAQFATLAGRFGSGPVAAYVRFDPVLPESASSPDNFSKANIENLNKAGVKLLTDRGATLDRTADFLAGE